MRRIPHVSLAGVFVVVLAWGAPPSAAGQEPAQVRSGREVYETVCTTCHGPDGKGGVNPALEEVIKPPDFSNCEFAAREPDRGFLAVAHNGGPARGFSPLMAPWGGTFTEEELRLAVSHIRTFCADDRWPRGELNLPRPLVTAKAFPEDEAVVSTAGGAQSIVTKFIYERRFGALNQVEIIVPVSSIEGETSGYSTGIGDIALEYKRVLAHGLSRGNIASVTAEFVLPTGNEAKGRGGDSVVFEPFLTFGQILPHHGFVQAQLGFGFPLKRDAENEMYWRATVGKTFEQSPFGRQWSPMVEILAARPFVSGADIEWDVLPGFQVTLNARQHVRLATGLRVPVSQTDERRKSLIVYLLWDWYEGGFLQGW